MPQAIPAGVFLVKNNSDRTLHCRYRVDEGEWLKYFKFRPGAEFTLPHSAGMLVYFFCDPPVKRVSYRIRPGERYSILPADDGGLELRDIVA